MSLIKVCPNCYRSYPDISLNYCTDDGSVLSQPIEIRMNAAETEIETVIRDRIVNAESERPSRSRSGIAHKKETDRFIEATVRKHKTLAFHVNSGSEHCVEIVGRERRGSLWIRPRFDGYRLQTTGQAQRLDRYIVDLCGPAIGSAKPQVYKYWYIDSAPDLEKIIDRFADLA
jgi:hypothetical protein